MHIIENQFLEHIKIKYGKESAAIFFFIKSYSEIERANNISKKIFLKT